MLRKSGNVIPSLYLWQRLLRPLGRYCPSQARADEAAAKALVKAMSDYMAAQKEISFSFDTDLEIVTKDKQKLALASSGR